MDEVDVRTGEQLFARVTEHLLGRRVQAREATVEVGHRDDVARQPEDAIELALRSRAARRVDVQGSHERGKAETGGQDDPGRHSRRALDRPFRHFAVSDSMVLGIADTLCGVGRAGEVRVIGHDGTVAALEEIQQGSVSADVSQYPYVMGEMAVEACVAAAREARLPARADAPIALLTRTNAGRAIRAFPKPFSRYRDPFVRLARQRPR